MDKKIIETDIEKARQWASGEFLEGAVLMLDQLAGAPFPTEPRRMSFVLIAMCTRGQVKYKMDTQELAVGPGDLIVVSERHVIDSYLASPDMEGLCMMISVPFINEIIHDVSDTSAMYLFTQNHPVIALSERDQQVFSEYFYVIRRKISETGNHFRRSLVRALMLAMFYDLSNVVYQSRQLSAKSQSRPNAIFTQFLKLVEAHCKKERRVGWYAQQMCITPKYLSEMVKQASLRTPNDWIDNYVIRELSVQLKNSNKSIKAIAEELNFPNQSFLGKYFKEHVGMSPSDYRRK